MAETNQKELEKKMKSYVKAGRRAAKGSKRGKKKLRKMATNDLITVISKKATNHPGWYTKLGGELIGLNYGMIDEITTRSDLLRGAGGKVVTCRTTDDVIVELAITAPCDDTLRVAAQKIVNELRLVSGANTIYDVDDMIDYLLNIRSIWVALTQMRRSIRCLNVTDPHDIDAWRKYLMMSLLELRNYGTPTGFSDEFRKEAANTVNWLNTMVKAVRFMMPGNFSLFERTQWLFSNIFVDGTGDKFGTKMFVTREVPYYTHSGGTHSATNNQLTGPDMTVSTLKANVAGMITAFTTNVANVAIAGDLMKAYGMQSFYDPGQISYEERPAMVYDIRALEQIACCDVAAACTFTTRVYQYTGSSPSLTLTTPAYTVNPDNYKCLPATFDVKFVNTSDNEITPGETLSLTRLKVSTEDTYDSSNHLTQVTITDCGSEVVLNYTYIFDFSVVGGITVLNNAPWLWSMRPDVSVPELIYWMEVWSMDDYGPMACLWDPNAGNKPSSVSWSAHCVFDFSNWALLSKVQQNQFHKTALLSMLTPNASIVQQAVAVL